MEDGDRTAQEQLSALSESEALHAFKRVKKRCRCVLTHIQLLNLG